VVKRGPKPKGKVKIEWSADFAYVIGLIATDGCLYNDRRHMSFVSQDRDLVLMFKRILKLDVKIGKKRSKTGNVKGTPHIQFGDVLFYKFLESIGLTSAKSLTIKNVKVPSEFFFDFIRGCFDGDGSTYSYWDPRWRSSFMYYISFASGSMLFLEWIRSEIFKRLKIRGHLTKTKIKSHNQLKYAKKDSIILLRKMYYPKVKSYLKRKKLKIDKALAIVGESL
jgi:hypothetical protein